MTLPSLPTIVSVLLCTGLLLPAQGRAAQTPGEAPPAPTETRPLPGTQDDAPRRLMVDESEATEERSRPGAGARGLRVVAEVGGGLLSATVLTLGGGLAGGLICLATGTDIFDLGCFLPLFLGVFGGAAFGLPLGVWWVGELLGGDGSLLATMGGGVVGAVLGSAVLLVARASDPNMTRAQPVAPVLGIPLLTLAGCVLGYELFQREPRSLAARRGLQPLLTFTSGGAVVGLGGHF